MHQNKRKTLQECTKGYGLKLRSQEREKHWKRNYSWKDIAIFILIIISAEEKNEREKLGRCRARSREGAVSVCEVRDGEANRRIELAEAERAVW